MPYTLEMSRAKEHAPTPYLSVVFTFGLIVESIEEFGVCHPSHNLHVIVTTSFVKGNNRNKTRFLVSDIKFN
jgi:hypothetical protein